MNERNEKHMERTMPSLSKTMGAIRRKAVDLSQFNPIRESRLSDDQMLPLIMEPAAEQVDLAEWIRTHFDDIDRKVSTHGGILFRGFGLTNARDFERVAAALCRELYADYGDLPRADADISDRVYQSTP